MKKRSHSFLFFATQPNLPDPRSSPAVPSVYLLPVALQRTVHGTVKRLRLLLNQCDLRSPSSVPFHICLLLLRLIQSCCASRSPASFLSSHIRNQKHMRTHLLHPYTRAISAITVPVRKRCDVPCSPWPYAYLDAGHSSQAVLPKQSLSKCTPRNCTRLDVLVYDLAYWFSVLLLLSTYTATVSAYLCAHDASLISPLHPMLSMITPNPKSESVSLDWTA